MTIISLTAIHPKPAARAGKPFDEQLKKGEQLAKTPMATTTSPRWWAWPSAAADRNGAACSTDQRRLDRRYGKMRGRA